MTFTPVPKPPPRQKVRKPLQRSTTPIARAGWLTPSGKPMKVSNPERQRRRAKAYRKFLASAAWKAIRLATFAVHDFTCVLCGWTDESRTGLGLVADHTTYFRFGGQEIVGEDPRTLCRRCDRHQTMLTRPNWARGRRSTTAH